MSDQEHSQRRRSSESPTQHDTELVAKDTQALKDDLDSLLDEIDAVLEENAADFVSNYIQKGGE